MNTKITNGVLVVLVVLALAVGIVAYFHLPDQIASHWNIRGEADDYLPKFWGVFLFPILMAGLFVLYLMIPKIDPLRANIQSFRSYYNGFWILLFAFFFYIFGLMLAWNFGHRFDFTAAMIPAVAALWYGIGMLLEKSRRNWFVGIRTPWTLSSDRVWEKTHKLGGALFKLAGGFALAGFLFDDGMVITAIIAIPAAAIAVITIVYSYMEYRKQ